MAQIQTQLTRIPESEYERYRKECETYPTRIERFERQKVEYVNRIRRAIRFTIDISNFGTAPATDVDVKIHFPDGFELFEKDDLPSEPGEPRIPLKPRSEIEMTLGGLGNLSAHLGRDFQIPDLNRQMSAFRLKKTNSYDLTDHFRSIKHGFVAELRELFLIFDSPDTAKSFHCDYELRVANLTDPVTGQLHFVIETEADGG